MVVVIMDLDKELIERGAPLLVRSCVLRGTMLFEPASFR